MVENRIDSIDLEHSEKDLEKAIEIYLSRQKGECKKM